MTWLKPKKIPFEHAHRGDFTGESANKMYQPKGQYRPLDSSTGKITPD